MSWMDSWSRPSKHAAIPPPLYLTSGQGEDGYCHTCGRVNNSRKQRGGKGNVVKYCSDRCRNNKPGATDREIEDVIVSLLNGDPGSGLEQTCAKKRFVKGDKRITVTCDEIEEIVFGSRYDPTKVFGRRKNRASRVIGQLDDEWKSIDMEDPTSAPSRSPQLDELRHVRPPQEHSDVNGSIGGEKGRQERGAETDVDLQKRAEGQRKAEEREKVRRAARRAVVFGFLVDGPDEPEPETEPRRQKGRLARGLEEDSQAPQLQPTRRKCEAVMNGSIVEPSFAKGDWAIRWRESI